MEHAARTWISSTLACESGALAAACAVLDVAERERLPERLAATGTRLRSAFDAALADARVPGAATHGIAPFFFVRFDEPAREARWLAALVRHGVIAKRGAYNFAALAHDDAAIDRVTRAAHAAAREIAEA